jgi:hypothetical protein
MSPPSEEHLEWALRFEEEFSIILNTNVFNWAAVALFYSALHYIQAFLVERGLGGMVENHATRNKLVNTVSELRDISASYRHLHDTGWDCRYRGPMINREDIEGLLRPDFVRVKNKIMSLLR